ncbi:unnamed protein product [Rotaria sp. Silwood1]|nr:unnamed protein product [Rotaria sp. Silwood1]CAF3703384.1 unnamed protein product [Rotaria sp. Silwood1]CAF4502162.1 unnamed protein product [Rotaria sp. Silwood1]
MPSPSSSSSSYSTTTSSNDQCEHCHSTYTLTKRKKSCAVCRQYYCTSCAPRERHYNQPYRICLTCQLISSDSTTDEQLLALKVKHLRCYLQAKNISHHTCTEKQELVDLIVRNRHLPFTRLFIQQQQQQQAQTSSSTTTNANQQQFHTTFNQFSTSTSASSSSSSSSTTTTVMPPPPPPPPPPPKNGNYTNFQHTMSSFASQMNHFAANLQDYVTNTVSGVLHHALGDHQQTTTTTTTTTNNGNGTSTFNFGTTTNGPFTYTFSSPGNFVYTTTTNSTSTSPQQRRTSTTNETTASSNNVQQQQQQQTTTNQQRIRRKSLSELNNEQNIEDLSVRELKEILVANFVDYKGCVEKTELIEKVRRLYRDRQNEKIKTKELDNATASDSELCKVCMDAIADCVFLDCGHMVTCVKCGKLLAECPICRSNIVRVFDNNVSWIQRTFKKRECIKFIPSKIEQQLGRCCCGRFFLEHNEQIQIVSHDINFLTINKDEIWSIPKHTRTEPTDAFGIIEFEGMAHPAKAQYIRLSHDTRPDLVLKLFLRVWNLKLPRLVISIDGGIANFELQPKLKRVLKKGLFRAAKTTGAWIITNGCQQGVVKHVGDALFVKSPKAKSDIVCIGFSPWGVVEGRENLIGVNKVVSYHSKALATKNNATLNSNHYYFLLVDNGTNGKYGGEILLRKRFERFLLKQTNAQSSENSNIPVVCVVVEGGTNTIRMVLEHVTDNPPVPVVVCDGSGRAADLISFTHRYAREDGTMSPDIQAQLIHTIMKTFSYTKKQAKNLFNELMMCVKRRDLITIFRMGEESSQDIDLSILIALLRSTCVSSVDQLKLALTWNRVDIARNYILSGAQQWPEQALEDIMMTALITDKVEFCRLLLENGIYMQKFLTIHRLEELYNTRDGPPNTLHYIAKDIRKIRKAAITGIYTLPDIGLILESLMGHGYRSNYTRRRFRTRYATTLHQPNTLRQLRRTAISTTLKPIDDTFQYPYNELLIWAVLTKRHQMALFFWERGEEAMAKALVAYKLNKALAHEADDDELEIEVATELASYAEQFRELGLGVLEQCYRENDDKTCQLLTYELKNWSDWTCLSLAVISHHQEFVAHKCCQMILNDLWMGGMSIRHYLNWKVIASILFFPLVLRIEFKSAEELKLQPKTHEEHLATQNDSDPDDDDDDDDDNDTENYHSGIISNEHTQHYIIDENESKKSSKLHNDRSVEFTFENKHMNNEPIEMVTFNKSINDDHGQSSFTHLKQSYSTSIQQTDDINDSSIDTSKKIDELPILNENSPIKILSSSSSSIPITQRFYEFYNAPITKFWYNAIFYVFFLFLFTYMVLVRTPTKPSIAEYIVTIYLASSALDTIREICTSSSPRFIRRLTLYFSDFVHICDSLALVAYGIGFILRFNPNTLHIARVIYCLDVSYWWIHLLTYISVHKSLGPYIHIAAQNLIDLFNFIIIILIVLVSFGVSRQAIKYPNESWTWRSVKEIFLEPYFMIYGEVYAGSIDPPCLESEPNAPQCMPFHWVTPITMTAYLIFCNILLLSILIATFNNTYIRISKSSDQVWKYHRYYIVLKYESKPMLPPPLILFSHIFILIKIIIRYCRGKKFKVDHGLKLFLSEKEVAEIHDFEEEQVDEYFVMKDREKKNTTADQIALTSERVDATVLRIDDIYQRESQNRAVLQNLDWRLQRLEDLNMNTYEMIQKMFSNQSFDERDPSYVFRRRTSWFDDDIHDRRRQQRQRRSSLTGYELNSFRDKNISKSTTIIMNRTPISKHGLSIHDQIPLSKKPHQVQRRSTIHRLDSLTSNDFNINRIQSNEYTSITDVIDTTHHHEWRPSSPITIRPSTIDNNAMVLFESTKEETAAYDAEEQTHNLIGEIIRKRVRHSSINQPYNSIEPYCDSDRASLLSIDLNTSTSNLNLEMPDAKN